MRHSRRSQSSRLNLVLSTSLFFSLTQAVALVDFFPRNLNLPDNCNAVYETSIKDCTMDDFAPTPKCSKACVDGLVTIQSQIQKNCAGLKLDAQSLVGRFLKGDGIPALCPGFGITTVVPPANTQAPAQEPEPAPSSPPQETTIQISAQPTAAESSSTPTSSAPPESTDGGDDGPAIATDNQPPPPAPSSFAIQATNAPPVSSAADAQPTQLSNPDSGGGSPFDIQASSGGSNIKHTGGILALMLAGTVMLAWP